MLSYADHLFINMCRDILDNGFSTEGEKVRPKWEDGSYAYTIKKFGEMCIRDRMKTMPDSQVEQNDGTMDYFFHMAITDSMYYQVSGQSYVSYKGTVPSGSTSRIVVTTEMLKPERRTSKTLDRDYNSNQGANMADLYMNINA